MSSLSVRAGHSKAVDLWALGVLVYEMMTGTPPFSTEGSTDQQIYQNILESRYTLPASMSPAARDLVSRLLNQDQNQRLGCGRAGSRDIKQHKWFQRLDWNALERKAVAAPIIPQLRDAKDTSNYEQYDERDTAEPPEAGSCVWADVF